MGLFKVDIEVGNPTAPVFSAVEAVVVDTGAVYSMMPKSFLEGLGISATEEQRFTLADGNLHSYGLGEARFRIEGRERTTPVIFGEDGVYLLGAVSLEAFGLIADTTHQRLIPSPELYLVGIRKAETTNVCLGTFDRVYQAVSEAVAKGESAAFNPVVE